MLFATTASMQACAPARMNGDVRRFLNNITIIAHVVGVLIGVHRVRMHREALQPMPAAF